MSGLVRGDINIAADQTPTADLAVTGSFTGNAQTLDIDTFGRSSITINITGTWNMFIAFSGSSDGTNFSTISAHSVLGSDARTVALANGTYSLECAGYKIIRLSSAFYTSGTAVIAVNTSVGTGNRMANMGVVRTTHPTSIGAATSFTDQSFQFSGLNQFGLTQTAGQAGILAQWGKSYSVTTNILTTGTTLETDYLLMTNPLGSGIVARIRNIMLIPPQAGDINYRIYINPTVTLNGAAITPVGRRQTGQTAAACTFHTLPTIAARGSLIFATRIQNTANMVILEEELSQLLEANNRLLITVQQSAAGAIGGVNLSYSEQVS